MTKMLPKNILTANDWNATVCSEMIKLPLINFKMTEMPLFLLEMTKLPLF